MNWKEQIEGTPSSLRCWTLQNSVETDMEFGDEVGVYLISDNPKEGEPLQSHNFDFDFIHSILSSLDTYYTKAIYHIKGELCKNPEQFGLSEEEANKKMNLETEDFCVEFPSVTFYDDGSWMIRFADADFPVINYGFGIIVFFDGLEANEIDIISDEPEILE